MTVTKIARVERERERETESEKTPDTEYSVALCSRQNPPKDVIDFTERRLSWLIERTPSLKRKMILIGVLHDYRRGELAIAWRSGEPVFLRTGTVKDVRKRTVNRLTDAK